MSPANLASIYSNDCKTFLGFLGKSLIWMGFLKRLSETCIFHQKGKNFDRRKVVCGGGCFSFTVNTGEKK